MEMTQEMLAKARAAKSPEELLKLAKGNSEEMTEESAKAYFELLHPQTGEVSDEELDNVSGGGCHAGDGRLVVSALHVCHGWRCKKDGSQCFSDGFGVYCNTCNTGAFCCSCAHCTYEKGLWLCNDDTNRKK